MAVAVGIEDPRGEDVRRLILELNAVLSELSPPGYCYHMTVDEMAEEDTTVFVARDTETGDALGCGALRRHAGGVGEVKRMYTRPIAQGRGIGGCILSKIEALAESERLSRLVLETGHQHHAAWRVYERAAFRRCEPVLDYPDTPYSVYYEKSLLSRS